MAEDIGIEPILVLPSLQLSKLSCYRSSNLPLEREVPTGVLNISLPSLPLGLVLCPRQDNSLKLAARDGIGPPSFGSEPSVIPLYQRAIKTRCLIYSFFSVTFTVAPGFFQFNGHLRPMLDNNVVLFYYYAVKHLN